MYFSGCYYKNLLLVATFLAGKNNIQRAGTVFHIFYASIVIHIKS